jgi:hypothetical protein
VRRHGWHAVFPRLSCIFHALQWILVCMRAEQIYVHDQICMLLKTAVSYICEVNAIVDCSPARGLLPSRAMKIPSQYGTKWEVELFHCSWV